MPVGKCAFDAVAFAEVKMYVALLTIAWAWASDADGCTNQIRSDNTNSAKHMGDSSSCTRVRNMS